MAIAPSFGAEIDASSPMNEPIGVRAAPTMTTSRISRLTFRGCKICPQALDSPCEADRKTQVVYSTPLAGVKPSGSPRLRLILQFFRGGVCGHERGRLR